MDTISVIERSEEVIDEKEEYYKFAYYNAIDQSINTIFNQYYDILSIEILDALNSLILNKIYLHIRSIILKKETDNSIKDELFSNPNDWKKLKELVDTIKHI